MICLGQWSVLCRKLVFFGYIQGVSTLKGSCGLSNDRVQGKDVGPEAANDRKLLSERNLAEAGTFFVQSNQHSALETGKLADKGVVPRVVLADASAGITFGDGLKPSESKPRGGEVQNPQERIGGRIDAGFFANTVEQSAGDGAKIRRDSAGQIRGVVYGDGSYTGIERDSSGVSRIIRADAQGNVKSIDARQPDGSWESTSSDGTSLKRGAPRVAVLDNGNIEFQRADNGKDVYGTSGGRVSLDARGRAVSSVDRNGLTRDYTYSASGDLTAMKVAGKDMVVQEWRKENGLWNAYDKDGKNTGRQFVGMVSVDAAGTVRTVDGKTGAETILGLDGTRKTVNLESRTRTFDNGSRVIYDSATGFPGRAVFRENSYRQYDIGTDGAVNSTKFFNSKGLLQSELRRENGNWNLYDGQGKPVPVPPIKDVRVDNEGNMRIDWRTGSHHILKNDGSALRYDVAGKLLETEGFNGSKRQFAYDSRGELSEVRFNLKTGEPRVAKRENGAWNIYDGQGKRSGGDPIDSISVDQNIGMITWVERKKDTVLRIPILGDPVKTTLDGKIVRGRN